MTTFELWGPKSTDTDCSAVLTDVYVAAGPFRETANTTELMTEGCTFSDVPSYVSILTEKDYDKVFDIPYNYTRDGWEKITIVFEEASDINLLLMKAPGNYDNFVYFSGKTEYTLNMLEDGHNRTSWENIILYSGGGKVSKNIKIKRIYFSKGSGGSLETEDIDITSDLGSTNTPTIETKKAATAVGDKAFEITGVEVDGYDDLVLTFSSPTEGTWTITYDATSENIPAGSTSYSVDVSALSTISTLTLSVGAGDFPRFSNFEEVTLQYKDFVTMDATANDAIFSFDKIATGYDSETKLLTKGGWNFETPVDLRNWMYLVITTAQSCQEGSTKVTISDNGGHSFTKEANQYDGSKFRHMSFDAFNNENALVLDLYHLASLGLDLEHVKSLILDGYYGGGDANRYLSNVYVTNYLNTTFTPNGPYDSYHVGDCERAYSAIGKFGTICLPYKASVSGALVYSIANKNASGVSLERVDGLLEAGKPYFYMSYDEVGRRGSDPLAQNVQFFRADWQADVVSPIANNGLIGTFSEITAPDGANYLILSNNKLYNTEGATGDDAVIVGANKAYIDKTAISDLGVAVKAFISFGDDATKINAVENEQLSLGDAEIYNLAGQRMSKLQRGINIVNGKKVLVK